MTDLAVTWLQPKSNTRNDAVVVWNHVPFRVTFGFQPINGGAYILPVDAITEFKNFRLYFILKYLQVYYCTSNGRK